MAGVSIRINREDLDRVASTMEGIRNGYEKILVRSLNKTITGVRTDAVKEIGKEITPKAKIIRDTFKLEKANYARLTASVKSIGWPLPLINYAARKVAKGVSFKINKRDASRTTLRGAFIATMRSGHKGVFWRKFRDTHTARQIKPRMKYSSLPPIYRLPIRQRYGPAVPAIMEDERVMTPILAQASERLTTALNHELDFELSRL